MVECPSCGYANYRKDAACIKCGSNLPAHGKYFCTKCGADVGQDDKFCPNCGVMLFDPGDEILCGRCGARVSGNFCPHCGSPVVAADVKVRKKDGWLYRKLKPLEPILKPIIWVFEQITRALGELF
ncbi:MAG: zinc ribbon domain-containing protein [Candidatus Altiarchaeota archaeon]